MRLYELAYACRLYATVTDFDSSIKEFRHATNPALDIANPKHRKALLVWLNSWGCRQFAKDYHSMASKALMEWGRHHLDRLPHRTVALTELTHGVLETAAQAYGDLKDRHASIRMLKSSAYPVTFGPTGAAKVLYALRPDAFLPWDDPIREHFGYDGSTDSYREFLSSVQKEVGDLQGEAARFGIKVGDIPFAVRRPESSIPKLIDEYYWVTITMGCAPATAKDLERWFGWSRGPEPKSG